MKRGWAFISLFLLVGLVLANAGPATADGAVGNRVLAGVIRGHFSFTNADSIGNVPVQWRNWWLMDVINEPDGGSPVQNPKVQLRTSLPLTEFQPSDPAVFTAQPGLGLYDWSFQGLQVAEPAHLPVTASEGTTTERTRFSLSRSVSPEVLSGPETLQTVTASLKLEEALPAGVNVIAVVIGHPLVAYGGFRLLEGKLADQRPVVGWEIRSDGFEAGWYTNPADLEMGKTYTFQATLQSVKSADLIGAPTFKPEVSVMYFRSNPGIAVTGNSISLTAPDNAATITFSSDNVVDWQANYFDLRYHFHLQPVVTMITSDKPPFRVLIPARIRIEPESLSLKSQGLLSVFLELPVPYSVRDIDISTVTLQKAHAVSGRVANNTLNLKFRRNELQHIAPGEQVELRMQGELADGTLFRGKDTITVIE